MAYGKQEAVAEAGETDKAIQEEEPGKMTGDKQNLAIVSVSGGKDSTATALLAIEKYGAENCRFVFCDTGNEHEMTYEYITETFPARVGVEVITLKSDFSAQIIKKRDYIRDKWPGKGVPDDIVENALKAMVPSGIPFLDLCIWKTRFPSRMAQFCTEELKRRPMDAYMFDMMAKGYQLESWQGVRRDESANRKNALEREPVAEGWTIVRPIATWSAMDVITYVTAVMSVSLNPLYMLGMGRVGCMPCINCNKKELFEIQRRFPEHVDKIRHWEELVGQAAKRGVATFFATNAKRSYLPVIGWRRDVEKTKNVTTGEERPRDVWVESDQDVFARSNIDSMVEWSKTKRGGKEYDMFLVHSPVQSCSSLYHLCE